MTLAAVRLPSDAERHYQTFPTAPSGCGRGRLGGTRMAGRTLVGAALHADIVQAIVDDALVRFYYLALTCSLPQSTKLHCWHGTT